MKALTATAVTQGYRASDFNYCVEGELLWIGPVCAVDRANPDGECGCGRAFSGLTSHQVTTTAMVRDIEELTPVSYADALRMGLAAGRWSTAVAESLATDLAQLVHDWPIGAVAERRLDLVAIRTIRPRTVGE